MSKSSKTTTRSYILAPLFCCAALIGCVTQSDIDGSPDIDAISIGDVEDIIVSVGDAHGCHFSDISALSPKKGNGDSGEGHIWIHVSSSGARCGAALNTLNSRSDLEDFFFVDFDQFEQSKPDSANRIDIVELIETISASTKKKYVLDPRVTGKVKVIGFDLADIDSGTLERILWVHGYAAIESNEVVYVVPSSISNSLREYLGIK